MHGRRLWTRELAATLGICLMPLSVFAAEPLVPSAGSILQQTQPLLPPVPSANGTGLAIEQPGGATLPVSAPFHCPLMKPAQIKEAKSLAPHVIMKP